LKLPGAFSILGVAVPGSDRVSGPHLFAYFSYLGEQLQAVYFLLNVKRIHFCRPDHSGIIGTLLFLLLFNSASFCQLIISPNSDAQQLAQRLVGKGVTVSNATITGDVSASGFFKNSGGTQLAIDSGLVLSTGRVLSGSTPGMNGSASQFASSSLSKSGDPQLDALLSPSVSFDAVSLEFDFVPTGDSIAFSYIFSSEEYPEFICTEFNDAFAFFISGPGITGSKNIALVPGTNIPVAINTINSGIVDLSLNGDIQICNAMGAGSPFSNFYINNAASTRFTYNGHTRRLFAGASVAPCQTYHLKLVIADISDASFDSGVFLEAGSLTSVPLRIGDTLPVLNGLPYLVEECSSGSINISRSTRSPFPMQVKLVVGGSATNGTDYSFIPDLVTIPAGDSMVTVPVQPFADGIDEGIETIRIYISNGCQQGTTGYADSILINLRDYLIDAFAGDDTAIAKGEILQLNGIDRNGAGTDFLWSPASTLSQADISNPDAQPGGDITYHLSVSTASGCTDEDEIRVRVFDAPGIYVPTAFTPDGNGRNDLLRPILAGIRELYYFRVYDRWGRLVFSSKGGSGGWDGQVRGAAQATATYVWVAEGIDYRGTKIFSKGTSTLIR